MAAAERLMGVGVPDEVAKRVGFFLQTISSSGLTLKGPGNVAILATIAGATVNLDSTFDKGDIVIVQAGGASVQVAPDSGSVIWPTSAGVALTVSAGSCRALMRYDATNWFVIR